MEPVLDTKIIKNITSEQIEKLKKQLRSYYSEDVPRLIPFYIALPLIGSAEIFQELEGGFVKNERLELKNYKKF